MELGRLSKDNTLTFKFPLSARKLTHTHVIGGGRLGKSKLLQKMIEKDIAAGHGLCLIDWNGSLYHDLLRNLPYIDPQQKVVLIDPAASEWVTGFNPFMKTGKDTSVQVNRRIAATVRPWGDNPNDMPTFQRIARLIFTFAVENGETLPIAELLIRQENEALRHWLISQLPEESRERSKWMQIQGLSNSRVQDWLGQTMSTENRLDKFLSSQAVKRFFGIKSPVLNLEEEVENGSIILINLAFSDYLDREAASVFAPLLLNEFFEIAMRRANKRSQENPEMFFLYLDEFQAYINQDLASMLDQILKGGISLTLAHHHTAQAGIDPHLLESILVNARNRFVFGGVSQTPAFMLADDLYGHLISQREILKVYEGLLNHIKKGRETVYGSASNMADSEGQFIIPEVHAGTSAGHAESEARTETDIPWHDIRQERVEVGTKESTLEERRYRFANGLMRQAKKTCVARILDVGKPGLQGEPTPINVFKVEDYGLEDEEIAEWIIETHRKQGAITAEEADQQLRDNLVAFLKKTGAKLGKLDKTKPRSDKPKEFVRRKKPSAKSE